jgi:ferredoxin-type protein NapH
VKARHLAIQVFRRFCQVTAMLFIGYAAISAHWRNLKVSHNSARLVGLLENDLWGEAYALNERVLSWFGEPLAVSDGFLGVPWGATVAGLPFTDPLSVVALAAQGQLPPMTMLLSALIPLGLALVGGKVYCSFLCPARLAFELGGAVRMGLQRLGLPLGELRIPRLGLWVLLGVTLFSAGMGMGVFHLVLPYLSLSQGIAAWAMTGTAGVGLAIFAALLLVEVFVAPGQICRSLCPTGAVLEQVGRASPFRLEKQDRSECPSSCNLCQRVCPYGLFPGRETHHPSCDACGRCTLVCPDDKLAHGLQWGVKRCSD